MVKAAAAPIEQRRYELVTLAASLGIASRHCRLISQRSWVLDYCAAHSVTDPGLNLY